MALIIIITGTEIKKPIGPNNVWITLDLKRGYTNTDYLALGFWAESKGSYYNVSSLSNLANIGVFVDGSDPFTSSVSSLIGRATYSGPIRIGFYNTNEDFYAAAACWGSPCRSIEEAQQQTDAIIKYNERIDHGEIYGNINLTADFGDANSLGHIEGSINNIRTFLATGRVVGPFNGTYHTDHRAGILPGSLNLERAAIGESHSGFFAGNVSGRLNQKQYTGQWGGQFYGNGSSHPDTVAGTMAVSSEDGHLHFMAPWAADRR